MTTGCRPHRVSDNLLCALQPQMPRLRLEFRCARLPKGRISRHSWGLELAGMWLGKSGLRAVELNLKTSARAAFEKDSFTYQAN